MTPVAASGVSMLLVLLLAAFAPLPALARKTLTPKPSHTHPHHPTRRFDLYVFAGPDNWTVGANDTLVVFRVDLDARTVHLQWKVDVGSVGNEPHHMSFIADRRHLAAGGLLSFASGLPSLYFFRTSPDAAPQLFKTSSPPNCTAVDIGIEMPDGGLLFSFMGGPGGGAGGQLVRYDKDMNYVAQYPPNPTSLLAETGSTFQPHGITISNDKKLVFSSDFVEPISTVPAYGPPRRWGAIRMFNAIDMRLVKTYTAPSDGPNPMGAMDVIWIKDRAVATCTATGKLYCTNPEEDTPRLAYDFGHLDAQPQILVRNSKQTVLYVSAYGLDAVFKLDARDPCRLKFLEKLQLPKGAGPHSMVLSPDEKVLMVTDYFLEEKNIGGVIHESGDQRLRFIDTDSMKEITSMQVDFHTLVNSKVVYRPHGMAILELPKK